MTSVILALFYRKENRESDRLCINFKQKIFFYFYNWRKGYFILQEKKHLIASRNRKICEIREIPGNI